MRGAAVRAVRLVEGAFRCLQCLARATVQQDGDDLVQPAACPTCHASTWSLDVESSTFTEAST